MKNSFVARAFILSSIMVYLNWTSSIVSAQRQALKADTQTVCGIIDDGLYFNSDEGILANHPDFLEKLFSRSETLVALHCEDDGIIKSNMEKYRSQFGSNIPLDYHSLIRSKEAWG